MKKVTNIMTLEEIKEAFSYDPVTGSLTYRNGSPISFIINDRGYRMVRHKNTFYGAARICIALIKGKWPLGTIEYMDGDLGNFKKDNIKEISVQPLMLEPGERRPTKYLEIEKLKEILVYDEETGHITWKVNRGRKLKGSLAGYVSPTGYRLIQVLGTVQTAQRIAYMLKYGKASKGCCRFKDGNRLNLKWENLQFKG